MPGYRQYGAAVTPESGFSLSQLAGVTPRPRRPWLIPLLCAAAVIVLGIVAAIAYSAGRASVPRAALPAAVSSPTATAASAASPSTPTPSPTGGGQAAHRLGERVVSVDGTVDMTVFAYKQPVAKSAPPPDGEKGYVWGAAEVRVCVRQPSDPPVGVSEGPWSVVYTDGAIVEPSSSKYDSFPRPEYPVVGDRIIRPGRCVRGWIVFPVPAGKRPSLVEYAPESEPLPMSWRTAG